MFQNRLNRGYARGSIVEPEFPDTVISQSDQRKNHAEQEFILILFPGVCGFVNQGESCNRP